MKGRGRGEEENNLSFTNPELLLEVTSVQEASKDSLIWPWYN